MIIIIIIIIIIIGCIIIIIVIDVYHVYFIPYAYGTYHMRIRIWYDRTRMIWLFVPYVYIAVTTIYYYTICKQHIAI